MSIATSLHAVGASIDPTVSRWEVHLTTGKVLTESKLVLDIRRGGYRLIDWALDLNSTGDLQKIKQIWLICPGGQRSTIENGIEVPIMFDIDEPGTVFQFKHGTLDALGACGRNVEAQCIGKVTDKVTGDCDCWIWDRVDGLIHYKSNINTFGMWRKNTGLMPLTNLSEQVTGLRLG